MEAGAWRAWAPAVAGVLIAALLPGCSREEPPERFTALGPAVRVQVLSDQSAQVSLRAQGPVRISTLPDLVLRFEGPLPQPAQVLPDREGFRIAGEFYPSPIRIHSPGRHPLSVRASATGPGGQARSYRGSLDLLNVSGRTRVINEVSTEEYLAGVVGNEMPGDFAPPALESQAVASRTYVLYHLQAFGQRPLGKALPSGPEFQVYRGLEGETAQIRRAVQSTAGWVLTYQGKLFPAYYHSTCGGNTTSGALVFGQQEIPPLRGVPCDGCAASPSHRWALTLPLRRIEELIRPWAQAREVALGELRGIEAVQPPLPGGYLRYVRVVHTGGSFEMRADHFRERLIRGGLNGLRSTSFEVAPGAERGTLAFHGAGWGHGVGMCQWGAGKRGRRGSHGEVLAYYYPESELKKIY